MLTIFDTIVLPNQLLVADQVRLVELMFQIELPVILFFVTVLSRVEELANEPEGFVPENKIPFEYHMPPIEIISKLLGKGVNTKIVNATYEPLIKKYNNEFNIMFNTSIEEINSSMQGLGNVINQLRNKTLHVKPGYDGVYGEPVIKQESVPQKGLIDF